MKRYLILLILLLIPINIHAINGLEITSVTDKCHIVSKNTTVIPVKVVVLNNGTISSLLTQNKLGMIENIDDYTYKIIDFKSENIENISLDILKDSENKSNIYYEVKNSSKVKKNDILMEFKIKITFNGEYPSTLDILGNEIILSDKKSCSVINGYETTVSNREVTEYVEDNINYILFIIISAMLLTSCILILIITILRRKSLKGV